MADKKKKINFLEINSILPRDYILFNNVSMQITNVITSDFLNLKLTRSTVHIFSTYNSYF